MRCPYLYNFRNEKQLFTFVYTKNLCYAIMIQDLIMKKTLFFIFNLSFLFCIVFSNSEGAEWVFFNSTETPKGWFRKDFYDRSSMIKTTNGTFEVAVKMVFHGKTAKESEDPVLSSSLIEINCIEKQYKSKDYSHSDGIWKAIASDRSMIALYQSACLGLDINAEKLQSTDSSEEVDKLLERSLASFQKGDWDGVIGAATQVLLLNPKNEIAYTNRAGAYAYKRMLQEALSDCNNAININPDFGLAYNNRGYVYELLGQLRESLADYKKGCGLGNSMSCTNAERLVDPSK